MGKRRPGRSSFKASCGRTVFCASLLLCLLLGSSFALDTPSSGDTSISVYFSPHGGATEAIVQAINNASSEILVQAYSFTSVPIAKALVDAHRRSVHVEVVLDKSQVTEKKYSSADFLSNMGIPTFIDSQHAISHSKTVCLDGSTVISGSMNFTNSGENSNLENVLVIRNAQLAKAYRDNFFLHKSHSVLYRGRDAAQTGDENESHKKKSGGWRSLLNPLLNK